MFRACSVDTLKMLIKTRHQWKSRYETMRGGGGGVLTFLQKIIKLQIFYRHDKAGRIKWLSRPMIYNESVYLTV